MSCLMNNKPKRVLHVVSNMHRGGAETMIMNLYRNIDRKKLQFDFLCHYIAGSKIKKGDYDDEIESLGGRIFRVESLGTSNPIKYIKNVQSIIKNNNFDIIHSHINIRSGFPLIAARLAGIKSRIVHSHTTGWSYKNKLISKILVLMIKKNTTKYCSCGNDAGEIFKDKNITMFKNGIDIESFINIGTDEAKELKIKIGVSDDNLIIGHIGRFSEEKNHKYIIKIAQELRNITNKFLILLVGDGDNRNDIMKMVNNLNLQDNIKFLGIRSDIPKLMKIFDVFILPSLFEGLPLVAIEAQSSGKMCIASKNVTEEIDMGLGLVRFLDISDENARVWAINILNKYAYVNSERIFKNISNNGYNAKENVKNLYKLYEID